MRVPEELSHLLRTIREPIVCSKCADEIAAGTAGAVSLRDYTRLEAGLTARGLQLWCIRHDLNVAHVDFDNGQPEVDFRCIERKVS